MPKVVEDKLKREAKKKGLTGKKADAYVYGTLNKLGLMKGNKALAEGGQVAFAGGAKRQVAPTKRLYTKKDKKP